MGKKNWILREYLSQKEAYWCGSALVLTSTLSVCECEMCVCVIACKCVRVIACICVCVCLCTSKPQTMHVHSQDTVYENFTLILPVCTWIKTTCVIFAQIVWSMQHSWAANEERALVTGQLCVYFPPLFFREVDVTRQAS